jgi:hypothetical protein
MDEANLEDQLDQQLREAVAYIDDDGFTTRVLRQLPPRRRPRQSLRAIILFGTTILASALAYLLSDGGRFVSVHCERLATLPTLWLFALALGSGMLVTAAGVVAAISKSHELQS